MCIIIGGLKKNLKRAEQVEGMRSNSYGFAISVVHRGPNNAPVDIKTTRSINEVDIMKVWDDAEPDDYIVTHSRIPSAGGRSKNLADVHGWEREGVTFFHNGTMTNVISLMEKSDKRTDSLFFFEEIFIPLYKSQGRNFNKLVDRVCQAVSHGSRLCFILPDGSIHYYGDFVTDHECMFSNRSYVVSKYATIGYGGTRWWDHDDDDYPAAQPSTVKKESSPPLSSGASTSKKPGEVDVSADNISEDDEDTPAGEIVSALGLGNILRLLLRRYVLCNVQELSVSEAAGDDIEQYRRLHDRLEDDDGVLDEADKAILESDIWDKKGLTEDDVVKFAFEYAGHLYSALDDMNVYGGEKSIYASLCKEDMLTLFHEVMEDTTADARLVNLMFDDKAFSVIGFARSFKVCETSASGVEIPFYMAQRTPFEMFAKTEHSDRTLTLTNAELIYKVMRQCVKSAIEAKAKAKKGSK